MTTTPFPYAPDEGLPVPVTRGGRHAALAQSRGWLFRDLDDPAFVLDPAVREVLPAAQARALSAVPVEVRGNQVLLAVANPDDLALAGKLRQTLSGRTVRLVYADPDAIGRIVDTHYSAAAEAERIGGTDAGGTGPRVRLDPRPDTGPESGNVSLLRLVIEQARREGASDIHIEPTQHQLVVRNRVDGVLRVASRHDLAAADGLLTVIKVRAEGMRTDNFLVTDHGVLRHPGPDGRDLDIRVETTPTVWGSSAVLRLHAQEPLPISALGFSPVNEARFRSALAQPYGLILFSGPVNSGKTTALYSSVAEKVSSGRKIITLEDPVEYKFPEGVTQIAVNNDQGLTYETGMVSILRQDNDVVLVGEVNDARTAGAAVDLSMTGTLVLTTLHANDAPTVIPRLGRLGIDSLLLASQLLAVVSQRLVRRLCEHCRVPVPTDRAAVAAAGFDPLGAPDVLYAANPAGCERCTDGYRGRVPVHEVMLVGEELADAIAEGAPRREVARVARAAGMTSMRQDGWEKVRAGITSLPELDANTRRTLDGTELPS